MGNSPVRPYVFVFNYDWFLKTVNTFTLIYRLSKIHIAIQWTMKIKKLEQYV